MFGDASRHGRMHMDSATLKKLRRAKGMTQQEIADALDVSLRVYQTWEQGIRTPVKDNLTKLADYLGVTTDLLLGRDGMHQTSLREDAARRLEEIPDDAVYEVLRYIDWINSRRS